MLPEAARLEPEGLEAESAVLAARAETSDVVGFISEASFRSTEVADENPSPEPERSDL